jgi:Tfp pilus assembly protein FimT
MKQHLQVFILALLAVFAMASFANAQDSAKNSANTKTL